MLNQMVPIDYCSGFTGCALTLGDAEGPTNVHYTNITSIAVNQSFPPLFVKVLPGNPIPTISSFAATPNPVTVNKTTNLNVSASGGVGTLSYAYTELPPGCTSSDFSFLACTPTSNGTFRIRAFVNDSAGQSNSTTTSLVVNPAPPLPQIRAFAATPNPVFVNHTLSLNVSASGGTGSLRYAYADLPPGCSTSNTSSLACTPVASGIFNVRVFVNDSAGQSANASVYVVVLPSIPVISSFEPYPDPIIVGQTTYLNVSASGGTGALTYAYAGLPSGCVSSNTYSLSCTPTTTGAFTVSVFVNDSAKHSTMATATLTVNPITLSSVTVSPTAPTVAPGGTQLFAATPTCTATCPSGISYAWTLNNTLGSVSSTTGSTITFTAGSNSGPVTLTVTATLNGKIATDSAAITISTAVTPILTGVTLNITSVTVRTGGALGFAATPACSPGSCPSSGITYAWSLNNTLGSVSPSSGLTITFTAGSTAGMVTLTVSASLNGVNKIATAAITITTNVVPILTGVTLNVASVTVQAGGTYGFTAAAVCSLGSCPSSGIAYAWSLNNTLGAVSPNGGSATTFTAGYEAGVVTLTVTATLNGKTASALVVITVVPQVIPPKAPGIAPFGLPGAEGYAMLGGILAAIAIVSIGLALLLGRSSSGGGGEAKENPSEESDDQAEAGDSPPEPPSSSTKGVSPPKSET